MTLHGALSSLTDVCQLFFVDFYTIFNKGFKLIIFFKLVKTGILFILQPNFAASLQILKVEIGGDVESTGKYNIYFIYKTYLTRFDTSRLIIF